MSGPRVTVKDLVAAKEGGQSLRPEVEQVIAELSFLSVPEDRLGLSTELTVARIAQARSPKDLIPPAVREDANPTATKIGSKSKGRLQEWLHRVS